MPATDLDLLIEAAQAAGDVARQYTGPAAKVWDKPEGAGPVTEADLAVNRVLEDTLRAARPDYGWLSEESEDDEDRLDRERVFIVDPIDGTRSFIEGSKTWAHSIALVEQGKVVAGVIYLPMRDKLYAAARGLGATLNSAPLKVGASDRLNGASMLAAKPNFDGKHWRAGEHPGLVRNFRPSLAYRMALVAEGRFDAMMTLRGAWEWDIAAGALILTEAGAAISDRDGESLVFNNRAPKLPGVLAANPVLHGELRETLKPGAII
ncbi:inositol monophosphatase family protein [Roseovarius rhodophyticola]|uniref:3'(2'),5'-bisphosphate nucleotidase CysQ n=1 Tax=Roseovarius rhodophyticola TaxID=3080827 RepID=A0ABZ2TFS8_9RHOB|nr:3'(2'),5'-bisphosphate nucleotidase CysQ [Roseovarius sp. W115]MDV2930686.1 3'(2'),5'-bisphosphate nucleotidase CysQ [Roseovarius sp. W115]